MPDQSACQACDDDIYEGESDESLLARFDGVLLHPDLPTLIPRLYAPEVRTGALTREQWWSLVNELNDYWVGSDYPPLPRRRHDR